MSLSDPLPFFAICAISLAVASAIALASGFYRERLAESGGRFEAIDGLRGFLALGVLGGHAVNMYSLYTSGEWGGGLAPFYNRAATAGVAIFFMITGFLFWLRLLRSGAAFDFRAFFASRIRRLAPMYFMSVLMALAVIFSLSGLALRVPPMQLVRELQAWLSFGFIHTGPVNGVQEAHAVNAVYWTLAYEWAFYLALPFLALFARGAWSVVLFVAVAFFSIRAPVVLNFVYGALAAALVHNKMLTLRSPWLGPVPLAALATYFIAEGYIHKMLEPALLFVFFLFVVHGYSAFGLFLSRPAKILGAISYSLYLTHCIVLFVVVGSANGLIGIESFGPTQYWLLAAFAAIVTVVLSAVTFQFVEYPFMNPKGRAVRRVAAQAA
jgi:peptidoglycan/LPS O-acetylase OafA/YrhL